VAAARGAVVLVLDARLERAVDRVEEVPAVALHVEAQEVAAEQPVEELFGPGQEPPHLAVRPGDVPEVGDEKVGAGPPQHARQEREVVVVDEDHARRVAELVEHRVGEGPVGRAVVRPVSMAEDRRHVRDVAERPERLVGEAVVVAALDVGREAHAAQAEGGALGGPAEAVARVGDVEVGGAAAVRDPGAAAGLDDGQHRRRQPARGLQRGDAPPLAAHVQDGGAVRDHDQPAAGEALADELDEALARIEGPRGRRRGIVEAGREW
jgi:hypothetical protein